LGNLRWRDSSDKRHLDFDGVKQRSTKQAFSTDEERSHGVLLCGANFDIAIVFSTFPEYQMWLLTDGLQKPEPSRHSRIECMAFQTFSRFTGKSNIRIPVQL
jgi:hypothetical protein